MVMLVAVSVLVIVSQTGSISTEMQKPDSRLDELLDRKLVLESFPITQTWDNKIEGHCGNMKQCKAKRSAESDADSQIVDDITAEPTDVYTELDEAEEDARMMQINELLKMIESQEKAGGESCTPGTELNLGENIVDSYGKVRIDYFLFLRFFFKKCQRRAVL